MQVIDPVCRLLRDFSIETTPRGALKVDDFREHLASGTRVYVTSLPGSDFSDTLRTCVRLRSEGMEPVPHFTARSIADENTLSDYLDRATSEAGVRHVLALGGADREPAGNFEDSAQMIETGLFGRYGIQSIGIAGHPEGSPDIERLALRDFGLRKIRYARDAGIQMYLVTQFIFDAKPLLDWVTRIRGDGNSLPVIVGVPGPASLKALIGHATNCGVGASMNFLTRQARHVSKLLSLQTPDELVEQVAQQAQKNPELGIAGLHLFTLGSFAVTADWARNRSGSDGRGPAHV
jgi:methylenetetrahydrofolate reductase (NADPH)